MPIELRIKKQTDGYRIIAVFGLASTKKFFPVSWVGFIKVKRWENIPRIWE